MLPDYNPLLARLGPTVLPFERSQFNREVLSGENVVFLDYITSLESGTIPPGCLRGNPGDADRRSKTYLWVIDEEGLRVILEATPNPHSARGCVCHTNITGLRKAYQGGELWFGDDNVIYLNNQSGRFGAVTLDQRQAVLEYFQRLGFSAIQLPNRPG